MELFALYDLRQLQAIALVLLINQAGCHKYQRSMQLFLIAIVWLKPENRWVMAAVIHYGIVFEVKRTPTGWCVVITCPNGAHVEYHDFESEAGAKAWIKVNARLWAINYLKPFE